MRVFGIESASALATRETLVSFRSSAKRFGTWVAVLVSCFSSCRGRRIRSSSSSRRSRPRPVCLSIESEDEVASTNDRTQMPMIPIVAGREFAAVLPRRAVAEPDPVTSAATCRCSKEIKHAFSAYFVQRSPPSYLLFLCLAWCVVFSANRAGVGHNSE